VKLSRQQCINLMQTVSKSGIDVFELRSGCVKLLFNRYEMADSTNGNYLDESDQSTVKVLSPLLGICRIASGDGALPYVQVGQMVSKQDIICSIDVLEKRFDVPAGTDGMIVKLNMRSGELVEYKQPLAVIRTVE
jgi:biotin carboxyl carrier protein